MRIIIDIDKESVTKWGSFMITPSKDGEIDVAAHGFDSDSDGPVADISIEED